MDSAKIISLPIPGITTDKHKLTIVTHNQILHSDTLFEHGEEVLIQHRDEPYYLRRTRNDKLILTK